MTHYPHQGQAVVRYLDRSRSLGTRRAYCCGLSHAGESLSAYWPNTAYFCPVCGEIWAREIYSFEFDYQPIPDQPWVVEARRCAAHGDGLLLTGKNLDQCSPEIIQREALILLERNQA
jgi:hypothetical protein